LRNADENTQPEEQAFVEQFRTTPIKLAVLSLFTYLVQKFGGDRYFGGMVKESSFIRNMHKDVFVVMPEYVVMWLRLFTEAIDKTDLGPRQAEVKAVILSWAGGFGKTIVNHGQTNPERLGHAK
jgi:truncated hemoglobin YjbI